MLALDMHMLKLLELWWICVMFLIVQNLLSMIHVL